MTINQLSFEEVMEILKSGDLERIKNIYVLVPYKKTNKSERRCQNINTMQYRDQIYSLTTIRTEC